MTTPSYPRPDFVRTNLTWASLNGPWSFLFDDTDAGLTASWHKTGLPCTSTSSLPPQDGPAAATPHHDDTTTSSSQHHHARRTIQVPFVFQSQASGIHCTSAHNVLWYERRIRDPRTAAQRRAGHRALLRFGAVDYHATVWVDGRLAGAHRGGHVPFDLDVSEQMDAAADDDAAADAANDEHHRVTLRVFDSATDLTQPRGKQFWGPLPDTGIFYTPSSGIWQSVWAESVPGAHIADASAGTVLRADDITAGVLRARVVVLGRRVGAAYSVDVGAAFAGVKVAMGRGKLPEDGDGVDVEVVMRLSAEQQEECARDVLKGAPLSDDTCWRDGVALWSPEHPLLYDVTIRLLDGAGAVVDEITTSTGMRSLDWLSGSGAILLNGRPYFQALVLDQGYWPATLMTPPTPDALRADIELAKRMGFNGCRKHQKVEDPVFLHWADRLGYLVWGEMANAYAFSREYVERFDAEWREAVARDVNHPCVVAWTPGNESWGYLGLADNVEQRNHIRSLYYTTKTLDPTRPVNDNCGWEHVQTDLTTFHDYADHPTLARTCASLEGILSPKSDRPIFVPATATDAGAAHRPGAPVLCTEFGGVNIAAAAGPAPGRERDWGYTTAADAEDLLRRIEGLMRAVVDGGICCGFVYTQLTDIEQETNGLYTFAREEKLDAARVKTAMDEARRVFYSRLGAE